MKILSRLVGIGLWIGVLSGCLGLVLQLTIRDRWQLLAPVFYATPLPLCLGAFAAFAIWNWRKRKRLRLVAVALAILCLMLWLSRSSFWSDEEADLRVAFWNVSDHREHFEVAFERLDEKSLDLLLLAEAPGIQTHDLARERGFEVRRLPKEMVVACRGRILDVKTERLPQWSIVHEIRCEIDGRDLRVVFADIGPRPNWPRGPALSRVLEIANAEPNTIVVGDLNTPVESVWIEPFREKFAFTGEVSGPGMRETWPWVLPVLTLDQIWVSKGDFEPLRCDRRCPLWHSDHFIVIADLRRVEN